MLSEQCDKLRSAAKKLDSYDAGYGSIASMLREAADTIWQLRDDLQRANAENALLRSELESVGTAAYLYGRGDLKAENAKLRELVARAWGLFLKHGSVHPCDLPEVDAVRDEMRELGVEVD